MTPTSHSSTTSGDIQERAPRSNTAAGITSRLAHPGYHVLDQRNRSSNVDGMCVRDFIAKYLQWKQAFNVSDAAGNELLKFLTGEVMLFKHSYPRSWHVIRQLIQPEDDL